jgi:hypothetical protein
MQLVIDALTLDELLRGCPDRHDSYVFRRRLMGEEERVCQVKVISYWRAQQLWDAVRAEAEDEKRKIVSQLGRRISNQKVPCQFFIPKFLAVNFFSRFDSQPSANDRPFSVAVAVWRTADFFRQLDLAHAKTGGGPAGSRRCLVPRNLAILKVFADAFEATALKFVLDQEDIRSFLAVTFCDLDGELLAALGLDETSLK